MSQAAGHAVPQRHAIRTDGFQDGQGVRLAARPDGEEGLRIQPGAGKIGVQQDLRVRLID